MSTIEEELARQNANVGEKAAEYSKKLAEIAANHAEDKARYKNLDSGNFYRNYKNTHEVEESKGSSDSNTRQYLNGISTDHTTASTTNANVDHSAAQKSSGTMDKSAAAMNKLDGRSARQKLTGNNEPVYSDAVRRSLAESNRTMVGSEKSENSRTSARENQNAVAVIENADGTRAGAHSVADPEDTEKRWETVEHSRSGVHATVGDGRKRLLIDTSKEALDAVQGSYKDTDYAQGKRTVQRYSRILGVGTASRAAAISDLKHKYYLSDKDSLAIRSALKNNPNMSGKTALRDSLNYRYDMGTNVFKDYRQNSAVIDKYLEGYGFNSSRMSKEYVNRLLKDETKLEALAGPRKEELKVILREKQRNLKLKDQFNAVQSMGGGLKNTARTWVGEALNGTDVAEGYRTVKGMVYTAKAVNWIEKGVLTGTAQVAIKGGAAAAKGFGYLSGALTKDMASAKEFSKRVTIAADRASAGVAWYGKTGAKQKAQAVAKGSWKAMGAVTDRMPGVGNLKKKVKATYARDRANFLASLAKNDKWYKKAVNFTGRSISAIGTGTKKVGRFMNDVATFQHMKSLSKANIPVLSKIAGGLHKTNAVVRKMPTLLNILKKKIRLFAALGLLGVLLFAASGIIAADALFVAITPHGANKGSKKDGGDTNVELSVERMKIMLRNYFDNIIAPYCVEHYGRQGDQVIEHYNVYVATADENDAEIAGDDYWVAEAGASEERKKEVESHNNMYFYGWRGNSVDTYSSYKTNSLPAGFPHYYTKYKYGWLSSIIDNEAALGGQPDTLYRFSDILKNITCLAHVVMENDPNNSENYVKFCEHAMQKVLDAIKYKNEDDTPLNYDSEIGKIVNPNNDKPVVNALSPYSDIVIQGDFIEVYIRNCGLSDIARLMKDEIYAFANGQMLIWDDPDTARLMKDEIYAHADGRMLTWDDENYYFIAQEYHEYTNEEWKALGFDFDAQTELLGDGDAEGLASHLTSGSGGTYHELSEDEVKAILESTGLDPSDPHSKQLLDMLTYALAHVGCEYNQDFRFREDPPTFDCSSLAYRAMRAAGIQIPSDINVAGTEAEWLSSQGKIVTLNGNSELKPGDLIFRCGDKGKDDRFLNIGHVSIYVGNGMIVQATDKNYGVEYKPFKAQAGHEYVVGRL